MVDGGYGTQQPGMLGISPNYSYAGALAPNSFRMNSPATGLAGMTDALINGYFASKQGQGNQPMQLASAPQSGFGSLVSNLFGNGPGNPPAFDAQGMQQAPDPSSFGVY